MEKYQVGDFVYYKLEGNRYPAKVTGRNGLTGVIITFEGESPIVDRPTTPVNRPEFLEKREPREQAEASPAAAAAAGRRTRRSRRTRRKSRARKTRRSRK